MNAHEGAGGFQGPCRRAFIRAALLCVGAVVAGSGPAASAQERPSTRGHVPELARYLDRVEIAEPVVYRHLAVYPVVVPEDIQLRGGWLTLDAAVSRGLLVVKEKGGGGSVPVVVVENRSGREHVFMMSGEVLSGGKQTRTVRDDVVLAPGQRVELSVFCVEARRWEGSEGFSAAKMLLPQSIQKELRSGADQGRIWSEVARNNAALEAENASGSLELALRARPVQEKLDEVRKRILPEVPEGTVGFIFATRDRALGAEFFGRDDLARDLLPKLLDSYAVDYVLLGKGAQERWRRPESRVAIELFKQISRAGSHRSDTPGSGAGIRTRSGGLMGDGVSLGDTLVHYGVQIHERVIPLPGPRRGGPLEQQDSPQQQRSR